ncbi:MAG: FAD:protein FMN transferase [Planctomycetota bacterium]|nr:MAG: FAD:protein FMN transferase [Planctomycetota bacterium]
MAATEPPPEPVSGLQPLPDLHTLVVGRDAMACRFELVFNAGEVSDATELSIEALDLVDRIEDRITVYRDASEIAVINAAAASAWQPVAADIIELLSHCAQLHHLTAGAFDPAAGSLVRTWGFLRRQGRTPDAASLAAALAASGMQLVEIDRAGGRVRFTRRGVEINLGAIGKGWAIDRVVEMLSSAGVRSVLVHGGSSSVRACGIQGPSIPGREGWRVGVRHPLRPGRRLATVSLCDQALGTSGSGTQFFVDRGRRLGHILDPRTGIPAEGVLSATVITKAAADADALSTALYVLGPEGLGRIAPAGGETAAILVVPSRTAGAVRVLTANLPPERIDCAASEGIEVVRAV